MYQYYSKFGFKCSCCAELNSQLAPSTAVAFQYLIQYGKACHIVSSHAIQPAKLSGFKCHATVVLQSNLILEFTSARHKQKAWSRPTVRYSKTHYIVKCYLSFLQKYMHCTLYQRITCNTALMLIPFKSLGNGNCQGWMKSSQLDPLG